MPLPGGLTATHSVELEQPIARAAVTPNSTRVRPGPVSKPVPGIRTTVYPLCGPVRGSILVTAGTRVNWKSPVRPCGVTTEPSTGPNPGGLGTEHWSVDAHVAGTTSEPKWTSVW